jgi:Nicotinate phosphoribosyltransferase (NAPRTase) N-terminal domain
VKARQIEITQSPCTFGKPAQVPAAVIDLTQNEFSQCLAPQNVDHGITSDGAQMDLTMSPLLTDLYQLNMIQAYLDHGETNTALFEFFVRKLPPQRGFLAPGRAQTGPPIPRKHALLG